MKARSSSKIRFSISGEKNVFAPINQNLFSWVIDNIIKNAVDAMDGEGDIKISIEKPLLWLQVISDIAKNNQLNFSRLLYPDNLVRIN